MLCLEYNRKLRRRASDSLMTAEKWFIVEGTDPAGRKFRGIYSEDETAELLRDETNQLIGEK